MIDKLNKRFLKFFFNKKKKTIDKFMILYYRTHGSKQRINNKSIRVGYNNWILVEAYGYLF